MVKKRVKSYIKKVKGKRVRVKAHVRNYSAYPSNKEELNELNTATAQDAHMLGRKLNTKKKIWSYSSSPVSFKPAGRSGLIRVKTSDKEVLRDEVATIKSQAETARRLGDNDLANFLDKQIGGIHPTPNISKPTATERSVENQRRVRDQQERIKKIARKERIGRF